MSASRDAAPPRPPRSSRAATSSRSPFYSGADEDHRDRDAALPLSARSAVPCRVGPVPRDPQDATLVLVRTDDGITGCAGGDGCPIARCSSACSSASTSATPTPSARSARRSTSTAAAVGGRGRGLGFVGRALGEPSGSSSAVEASGSSRTPRPASSSAPEERVQRCVALASAACVRSSSASTAATGATTSRRRGVREAVGPARDDGRREPGLADARRPRAALGRRDRRGMRAGARAARGLLARGAAPDGRPRGLRGARAPRPGSGSPPARWCARAARRGTSSSAGSSTSSRRTCCSSAGSAAAGGSPRSRTSHGRAGRRTRGRTASGSSRTSTVRSRCSTVPVGRGAVRPAGAGGRSGATGCSPDPLEIASDGTIAPPPGPGSASSSTSTRLERWRVG